MLGTRHPKPLLAEKTLRLEWHRVDVVTARQCIMMLTAALSGYLVMDKDGSSVTFLVEERRPGSVFAAFFISGKRGGYIGTRSSYCVTVIALLHFSGLDKKSDPIITCTYLIGLMTTSIRLSISSSPLVLYLIQRSKVNLYVSAAYRP